MPTERDCCGFQKWLCVSIFFIWSFIHPFQCFVLIFFWFFVDIGIKWPLPEYTKNILEKFHKVVLTPSSYLSSSFLSPFFFLSFFLSLLSLLSLSSALPVIFLSVISGKGAEDLQSQSTVQQYLQEEQWWSYLFSYRSQVLEEERGGGEGGGRREERTGRGG